MSESFRAAAGRKVVSTSSATVLGAVSHLLVHAGERRVCGLVVGKGRKARIVDWAHLTGFGPDAVMVADEAALREPANDDEHAAADGKLDLVGRRALSELGTELGTVDDVVFDSANGALDHLVVAGQAWAAQALLGSGSYAVVFAAGAPTTAPSLDPHS